MNESISIINSIELIPLEDTETNPYLTRVRIKVFHLGENRNGSYIDKPTAIKMAKTLRGNPIVARYREEDQDFTDHGEEIVINDKGVTFKVLTRPYGFVDLNAKVWFEDYNDTDEFGRVVPHTYLVTEGLIWTEYYEELKNTILKGGRPQSMELDPDTIQGEWSNKINPNCEIFIINDAIITKLCALGENTEPCFLGASIVPIFSEIEKEGFVQELLDFKNKFNLAQLKNEGGKSIMNELNNVGIQTPENATSAVSFQEENIEDTASTVNENLNENENLNAELDNSNQETTPENQEIVENSEVLVDEVNEFSVSEPDSSQAVVVVEEEKVSEQYALLEQKYNELTEKYALLEQQNNELLAFKQEVEDKEKDALINSFYMLSDEDKKDVIANKSKYSLDDIKKELSVICVDKRVNFNENVEQENEPLYTFNIHGGHDEDDLPAWLKAVEAHRNQN